MKNLKIIFSLFAIVFLTISCEKIVEVDPPANSISQQEVFQNADLAAAAMTGIYSRIASESIQNTVTGACAASADVFIDHGGAFKEFSENELTSINVFNGFLFAAYYTYINRANIILEGLASPSSAITTSLKAQIRGEALFTRAFCYFYLVNLYGPVSLQLMSDYRVNRVLPRSSISEVYGQILADLKEAETLLTNTYPSAGRVRPNLGAVQALLARVYLYNSDWANAERYSSFLIENTATYSLEDFDKVFLVASKEAIWQLFPPANNNTQEGNFFILTTTPSTISLKKDFFDNAFEANDKRKTSWVKSFTNNTGTYYYPFKYKVRATTTVTEYSMVLRLAEQYLIRAEARINLDKIPLGILDLNKVRQRSVNGINTNPLLPLETTLGKSDALTAVAKERKIELFSEWGHRWLDLKRTGQAAAVLKPIKAGWQDTDVLYPIPENEVTRNPKSYPNPGY